jgi:glycosyltransferase involved in cell wall biosynthesis/GT2 family glycosyltransferase
MGENMNPELGMQGAGADLPPIPTREELLKAGINIAVGIPMPETFRWESFAWFWRIAMRGWPLCDIPYGPTDVNRHKISEALLKSKYTHILMLDADHQHLPDVVERHARWVLQDPKIEVVGGLHHRRGEPYDPCVYLLGPDRKLHAIAAWESGLMKVDALGAGTLLVSRKVFEKIPPPWWAVYWDTDENKWVREDIYFSNLCLEHGIQMWCDTTAVSRHLIMSAVDTGTFLEFAKDHPKPLINIGGRKVLVIDGLIFQLQYKRPAGISRIWQNVIPELARALPDWKIILLRRGGSPTGIQGTTEVGIPTYDIARREEDREMLREKCRELEASRFLSTYYSRAGIPAVQLVYDLIPEQTGQDMNKDEWASKVEAFGAAEAFVSISQSTARDLRKIYHKDSTVALCGVSQEFRPREVEEIEAFRKKYELPEKYILLPGNRGGYKNGINAIRAVADTEWNLVCAGGEPPTAAEVMDNVYFAPHWNEREMACAYSGAYAMIYPSLCEGFGLPVAESLACGCPVIAGDHSSIREAGGNHVLFCDVENPESIRAALESIIPGERKAFPPPGSWKKLAETLAGKIVDPSAAKLMRKALISYISDDRLFDPVSVVPFSNIGIARSWLAVLTRLGYAVDVINWKEKPAIEKTYDLIIYHGGHNMQDVLAGANENAVKIYFGTGIHWAEFNAAEGKRFSELNDRRGIMLPPERVIEVDETPAYEAADGIIALGNANVRNSFIKFDAQVIPIGTYPTRKALPANRYERRKNFLFYSGIGNIHKGLDLLLEAFDGADADLYIATHLQADFAEVFAHELGLPNVHAVGWLDYRSKKFYEVINKCAWVVLASCAEGQPGSVVDCMAEGLVPITSKECNIDEGIHFQDNSVNEIRKTILEVAQYSEQTYRTLAADVEIRIARDHSPAAFEENLSRAVRKICSKRPIVSALVSVYNCEKFMRGCLEDLEAQSIADRLEIVVVNTGSEQGEENIVREFQKRYPNIRYLKTDERHPIAWAWNQAIKIAGGKYLTTANSDDRHAVDGLETLMRALDENPDMALAYGNQYITKFENAKFGEMHKYCRAFDWREFDVETLKRSCYMGPMPMWRRDLHSNHGYFDETLLSAFDWEYWLRIAIAGEKMMKIPDYVGLYLEREQSNEHIYNRDGTNWRERIYIQKKLCPECLEETLAQVKR